MSFRDDSQLDPSEVSDQRGSGGGGGFGGGVPGGRIAVGGGGLGIVGLIVVVLLHGARRRRRASVSSATSGSDRRARRRRPLRLQHGGRRERAPGLPHRRLRQLRAGASGVTSSRAAGATYVPATTYFESGQWQTGCGPASTDVGPFYCPADKHVYIDLGFLDELHDRLGATGRLARAGLRRRPRVRPPRPGSARHPRPDRQRPRGRDEQVGAHRAAGRLLRRRVGRARDRDRACSSRSRRRSSTMPSTRRRPSATTASRQQTRARSTPTRGRTAPPRSARSGSRSATRAAT